MALGLSCLDFGTDGHSKCKEKGISFAQTCDQCKSEEEGLAIGDDKSNNRSSSKSSNSASVKKTAQRTVVDDGGHEVFSWAIWINNIN